MTERYVGLISGTSIDGVDAVVASFDAHRCTLLGAATTPYPDELRRRVAALIEHPTCTLDALGTADVQLGRFFSDCTERLLASTGLTAAAITAIGHHGQTIYHRPDGDAPFTLQLGDPNVIAARTGITTVADFRRLDVALGGQGAPLVPAFHDWLFRDPGEARAIVNIGGIANVTVLIPDRPVTGFDTGPGNTLCDLWVRRWRVEAYDSGGAWAASGNVCPELLEAMLDDPYFAITGPKSTGRELFNAAWLERRLTEYGAPLEPADVQATLVELTAVSIARAVAREIPDLDRAIVCGGGAHNTHLVQRLQGSLRNPIETSDRHGAGVDWIEALAFAWLARARLHHAPGNVPTVTGAREAVPLGGIYSR